MRNLTRPKPRERAATPEELADDAARSNRAREAMRVIAPSLPARAALHLRTLFATANDNSHEERHAS